MKKKILNLMGILGLVLLVGCSLGGEAEKKNTTGLSEYSNLPADHVIETVNFDQAKELIETGSGILILSFPNCPWCQSAIPVVDEVAKELEIDNVSYLNVRELNKEEPHNESVKLKDLLSEFLTIEDGEAVLYVPDVYSIKEGDIIGHHLGTTDTHDAYEREMNEDEVKELKAAYHALFQALK